MTSFGTRASGPYLLYEVGPANDEVSGGVFAFDVSSVFQVIEPGVASPVPLAPDVVLGIINHHGRIVTLVDPAPLLGLAPQARPAAHAVILRQGARGPVNLGLQVSRIQGIVPRTELIEVEVQPRPCVAWVARAGRRLIHVVAVEPLLERLVRLFGTNDSRDGLQGVTV